LRTELVIKKGDSPSKLLDVVRQYAKKYPNGVSISIEPYCLPRTKAQNNTYQLWVKRASEQTGIPTDLLKQMAKDKAVGYGYPVERDEDGEPIMKYGKFVPISSKDATIGQIKILMEQVRIIALDHDVVLEDVKG